MSSTGWRTVRPAPRSSRNSADRSARGSGTGNVTARLDLAREQILAFRQSTNALDERLSSGPTSLRRAAWAGLQDSMPRAAVLSIHARVEGTGPDAWSDDSLVQLWGPEMRTSSCRAPIGSCWCQIPPIGASSGHLASGPAPSLLRARSAGPGDAPKPTSRSRCGAGCRARSARPWRRRRGPCR